MVSETYNGWANYETWNVALWIQNEFRFYAVALAAGDFTEFRMAIVGTGDEHRTPDGVSWWDLKIDGEAITHMIEEF
jgi:hypothetical protein